MIKYFILCKAFGMVVLKTLLILIILFLIIYLLTKLITYIIKNSKTMKVTFIREATGEVKQVGFGFSWILFLFSGLLGIPCFIRGLNNWGFIFLILWLANWIFPYLMPDFDAVVFILILGLIWLGLQIYIGVNGNELTAKNLLDKGFKVQNPEDASVKYAKAKWGLI